MPSILSNKSTPAEPIKHPVIAALGLLATSALVAAVLTGFAKGLTDTLKG